MTSEAEGRRRRAAAGVTAHTKNCSACPGVKALSFCVDCHEYLCTDCTSYHRRLGALRSHTLLTGDDFPSIVPPQRLTNCPDHPKEEVKFYCQNHNALCCVACNVLSHEQCAKSYIHDIAETFQTGSEYSKLRTDIQGSEQLMFKTLADIDNCLKAVKTLHTAEIETLKIYRTEINEYLDMRERELHAEMQRIHDRDVTLLHELQAQLKTHQKSLKNMKAKLKLHEKNSSELFIAAKRTFVQLDQLQSSLQKVTDTVGYQLYTIVRDPVMEKFLQNKAGFADVEQIVDMTKAKLEQRPSMQLGKQDFLDMVLASPNTILLTVQKQSKVILVNTESGQVLSEIVLKEKPRFLSMISANLAATTFSNKTIQFIQVNETTLMADSITNVDVKLYGIASYSNNLVVSYHPPGVRIITKVGRTIRNLDNTTTGREVFKEPRWITTTYDGSIYVTDWGTHEITRMDSNLTILQTLYGDMLKGPHGIISLNRDHLLVCSFRIDSIVLIRPSNSSMKVLLDKPSGTDRPRYICFCKEQKKLYVAPKHTGTILIYKLS